MNDKLGKVCQDCKQKDTTCPVQGLVPEYASNCIHKNGTQYIK